MASPAELFKQPLFIVKFVELLLIIVMLIFFIIWYGFEGAGPDYFNHIGHAFYFAVLSSLLPVAVMFGIHIAEGDFPEKKYEMIIAIIGAIVGGLGAIFLLVGCFHDGNRQSGNRISSQIRSNYSERDANGDYQNIKLTYVASQSGNDTKTGCVILAVFMLGVCATFIADAILSAGG